MGKPAMQVTTLHDCTIEELIKLQNESQSKYTRLILSIVIMRYKGYLNSQIIEVTGTSNVTIQKHLKNWNRLGLKSLKDSRGGNIVPKLTPEIIDDLLFVVLNKNPTDFNFIAHTWTCELMKLYIKQNYDIDVSISTIWLTY
jgi:transposase